MKPLNSLADILSKVKLSEAIPPPIQTSLPKVIETPPPEIAKVIQQKTYAPVNKQAALLLSPVRSWVLHPPPSPKPIAPADLELVNALKSERNDHALTKAKLGTCRAVIRNLKVIQRQLLEQINAIAEERDKLQEIVSKYKTLKSELYEQITRR